MKFAGENDTALTEEDANRYFKQLHPTVGELSDDELDDVSGGGCGGSSDEPQQTTNVNDASEYYYNAECRSCGRIFFAEYTPTHLLNASIAIILAI